MRHPSIRHAARLQASGPWLAAILASVVASTPAGADWPSWLEPWLFNSAERTRRAVESFEQGDLEAAVEPLETALRLAGDDPRVQYNAGAGRLGAGRGGALPLLEAAAEAAAGELAPVARYNLGNARMAGNDLSGAIEAYQQALRHDPDFEDAKYNLELARRRLDEQRRERQESERQPPEQPEPQNRQPSREPQEPPSREPRPQPGDEERQPQQDPQRQRQSPLPRFRDLPDMSAEEAAAILEAIENMEREGRRNEALEAARRQRPGEKDW